MRVGVVTFPGSLDDVDAIRAARLAGHEAVSLWHGDHDLQGADAVVLPVLQTTLMVAGLGVPGVPALLAPMWLFVTGIGLFFSKKTTITR